MIREDILILFTNKMFTRYCPDAKIEDYEVRNLATKVHKMTDIFMKQLKTLDKTGE